MAKYSPFAEKAGMQNVAQQQSNESLSKVSKVLFELGFDLQLLGSERYVRRKLESLSVEQMCKLKETFLRNNHPRFKREFAVSLWKILFDIITYRFDSQVTCFVHYNNRAFCTDYHSSVALFHS
jgi:hypothetical protein